MNAAIGADEPGFLTSALQFKTRLAFRVFFYGKGERKGRFSEAETPRSKLAAILGIEHSNLIPLLNGDHYPNELTVEKFSARLGIPKGEMLEELVVHVRGSLYKIGKNVPLMEPDDKENLFSPSEVATYLGIYQQKITAAIRSGELKAHRVGSRWRIPKAAVDEFRRKIICGRKKI